MTGRILIVVGILALLGVVIGSLMVVRQQELQKITTFAECAQAGFPVMESYPAQCRTSDGRSFTQEVTQEEDKYAKELAVTSPRPGQMITSPLIVEGKAQGSWFFEGVFSAELFDANSQSLGQAILTAQADWMTQELIPFKGSLTFTPSTTAQGTLVISNANPSGLSENAKSIQIPVIYTQ